MRRPPRLLGAAAVVAILGGLVLLALGLRADELGIGGSAGRSAKQTLIAVAGGLAIAGGLAAGAYALRGRWRRILAPAHLVPFLAVLTLYTGVYYAMEPPIAGDQPHYMLEAYSLTFDRDRNLIADYQDPARFGPVFGPFVSDSHAYQYTREDVAISAHNVGLPMLMVPVVAFTQDTDAMRLEFVLLAALAASVLLSILRRLGFTGWVLWGSWGAVVLSLPFVSYSAAVYPEMPGTLLLLIGVRALLEPQPARWMVVGAGVAAALMPWLHFRLGVLAVAVVLGLIWRSRPVLGTRAAVLCAAAPLVVSLLVMAVWFHHWYGSLSPTAVFKFNQPPPTLDLNWAYQYSIGGLFNPQFGWLPFAPLHLLAFVGAIYTCWRYRWIAIVPTAVAVGYLVSVASAIGIQTAFSFPGRLELVIVPLAAIPIAVLLRDVPAARVVALPLAVISLILTVQGVDNAAALMPPPIQNVTHIPLANTLSGLWPATVADDEAWRDVPHTLAIVALIAAAGAASIRLARPARQG